MATTDAGRPAFRIAGLDGLRALSIVFVFIGHLNGSHGFPHAPHWLEPLAEPASLGVGVFFAISGFLITSLLLREQAKTGGIALGRFYARRALRIFPAYYAFLLVVAVLWLAGTIALSRGELFASLLYVRNFQEHGSWFTGHAWSLAIEEQFYLMWPLALSRMDRARATKFAAAVVALGPLVRLITWFALPAHRGMIDWYTFTRIDSIMAGCLLALVHDQAWFRARVTAFYARGGAIACVVAVVASLYLRQWTAWSIVASYSVEAVCATLLIDWCVTHAETRVGRVLELRPVRFVGDLSYSLYLWQQLFLNRHSDFVLSRFPLSIVCAVLAAYASRRLIENPFLVLKERWSGGRTAPVAARPGVVP